MSRRRFAVTLPLIALSALATTACAGWLNVELVGQSGGANQAVAVVGDVAYVGVGPSLVLLDVSDPANPTVLGQSLPMPDMVRSVAVAGNYAYLADGYSGLQVIDVSNPAAPQRVGGYNTSGYARGVAVAGNHAYVADGSSGLQVIDISNPAAPQRVGWYDTSGDAYGVAVAGNHAYVADWSSGLQVIDISNPAAPQQVGGYNTSGYAQGVAVAGNYAYVADGAPGLQVINISNPAAPQRVGGYNTSGSAWGVAVAGNYAYVADGAYGLQVINISNPAAPQRVGGYNTSGSAQGVAVAGNHAYVADGDSGLQVINISNPGTPQRVGGYNTCTTARSLAVAGTHVYVADDTAGLKVIDISNLAAPYCVGTYDTSGFAWGVATAGNYACVSDHSAGLQVIDISDPAAPQRVGGYDTSGIAFDVAIAGSYAYVADAHAGLQVISIANPAAPQRVGGYDTSGSAHGVALAGNYAYVADDAALQVIDISNPTAPQRVGGCDTYGGAVRVAVAGNYAYVVGIARFQVIDVSNPGTPQRVGWCNAIGSVYDVAVAGNYAYLASSHAGLRVIDISNPTAPQQVGGYDTRGFAYGVAVAGSYTFVADLAVGLLVLRPFLDCNANGIPDPCDIDCGVVGGDCDLPGCGQSRDCDTNGVPDECEVPGDWNRDGDVDLADFAVFQACFGGSATGDCACVDVDTNGLIDLEDYAEFADVFSGILPDCNRNGVADWLDIVIGQSRDCDTNSIPDECDIAQGLLPDCNTNGLADTCEVAEGLSPDCNTNGIPDDCDIAQGLLADCNTNGLADECEVASGQVPDCNTNGIPDECDIADGSSTDCDTNGVLDECEWADCNTNCVLDACDLLGGTSADCNSNGALDECEVAAGTSADCNLNDVPDECEGGPGGYPDCNSNGVWDECDIAAGTSSDCQPNGVPDECDLYSLHTDVWNPADDFSITNGNPNGVWTYAWMDTGFTTFTPYTNHALNGVGSPQWYGWNGDWTPHVWMNESTSTTWGIPPGWIGIHPGPGTEPSILRWTAPAGASGEAAVTGQFLPGAGGTMTVAVRKNNVSIWSANDTGSFNLLVPIGPGDTLDFAVYGGYYDGSTPLLATVTAGVVGSGGSEDDCNGNEVPDECDIAAGTSTDCQLNGVPDECELAGSDCNTNGVVDVCDIAAGTSPDCNTNSVPDACDLAAGTSDDCQPNGILDECDIAAGTSADCQPNAVPDECDLVGTDNALWFDGANDVVRVPGCSQYAFGTGDFAIEMWVNPEVLGGDWRVLFCNQSLNNWQGVLSAGGENASLFFFGGGGNLSSPALTWTLGQWYHIAYSRTAGTIHIYRDGQEVASGVLGGSTGDTTALDFGFRTSTGDHPWRGVLDEIRLWNCGRTQPQIQDNMSRPLNGNEAGLIGYWNLDESTGQQVLDGSPLGSPGTLGADGSPGNDDPTRVTSTAPLTPVGDCNNNGMPDECDVAGGTSPDCNTNGVPDECDMAACAGDPACGDCDTNGIPDGCEYAVDDCDGNGLADACELSEGLTADCNTNGVPDTCDIAGSTSDDCQPNGVPDECDLAAGTSVDQDGDGVPDECLVNWTGLGDGWSWGDPNNWTPRLPTAGDHVLIGKTGTYTVVFQGSTAVNGLRITAPGATLEIRNQGEGDSELTVAHGFANAGTIDLTGTCGWPYPGVSLTVSEGTLVNSGTIQADDACRAGIHAELDNQGELVVNLALSISTPGAVNHVNSGVLRVESNTLTLDLAGDTFTNAGTIETAGGNLVLNPNNQLTNTGTITVGAGSLSITGGTFDQASGELAVNGPLALSGVMVNLGTDFIVSAGGALTLSDATVTGAGSITLLQGSSSYFNASYLNKTSVSAGLSNEGSCRVEGDVEFNSPPGAFSNGPHGTLTIESVWGLALTQLAVAHGFTNAGTIRLTHWSYCEPYFAPQAYLTVSEGALVNLSSGTIQAIGDSRCGAAIFAELDNQGELVGNRGLSISTPGAVNHVNSGTIRVETYSLTLDLTDDTFTNVGTIGIAGGTTFDPQWGEVDLLDGSEVIVNGTWHDFMDIQAGATVRGNGLIAFQLTNSGTVSPGLSAGQLTIGVDSLYHQYAGGVLDIELGGLTPATEYDVLYAPGYDPYGYVNLAGTLRLTVIDPFVPEVGDTFHVLSYSCSQSGQFENVELVNFPAGLDVDVTYGPGVTVEITTNGM